MKNNTQEKSLTESKEGFFSKVRKIFKNLFGKKIENKPVNCEKECRDNNFKNNIKVIKVEENEDGNLLELQKRYRRGEIAENDLTEEQIDALGELYDKQIAALRKIIEEKEKQIEENQKQRIEKNNNA